MIRIAAAGIDGHRQPRVPASPALPTPLQLTMSAPAAQEADTAELSKLCLRLDRVLGRLEALEHWAGITPLEALRWRQVALLDRICELEAAFGIAAKPLSASVPGPKPALLSRAVAPAAAAVAAQPQQCPTKATDRDRRARVAWPGPA